MTENTTPRTWDVHGMDYGPDTRGTRYRHFGEHRWVRLWGDHPIVPGRLIEDPDGGLMGWLDADQPGRGIHMVELRQLFPMQFPYGVQTEVDAGGGEPIPLRFEPLEAAESN
ncbi:hypothetical protein [Agromyces humi]|uniref:hypothetical protein n=1 Tax=Agromyces humi TaxID=1766800 RepID=UPI00135B18BC|nr:hypothetical protein [Agromyces humi]